jgi:hypothetical protein
MLQAVLQGSQTPSFDAPLGAAPTLRHGATFGEALGEGLGEAFAIPFGEPFRNPLMTERYHADITAMTERPPMTDGEYLDLLDSALDALADMERQIDVCCAAMRRRPCNGAVTLR